MYYSLCMVGRMLWVLLLLGSVFGTFPAAFGKDWKWFNQTLDHFGEASHVTFAQRYWHRSFAKEGGGEVVFLWLGGSLPEVDGSFMLDGNMVWIEHAKAFQAECFLLEHRYYGSSVPGGEYSKDYKYFNSDQALADVASFISAQRPDAKWVTFGDYYSGALAAWARQKYPKLVHAAIVSSAPLLAEVVVPGAWEIYIKAAGPCYYVTFSTHARSRRLHLKDDIDLFNYQLCHEFGWLEEFGPKGPKNATEVVNDSCQGDMDTILKGIAHTNAEHHGKNFTTERVQFIYGSFDIFSPAGKTVQDSPRVPVFIVKEGCPAEDTYCVSSKDKSQKAMRIRQAQAATRKYLKQWLNEPKTN